MTFVSTALLLRSSMYALSLARVALAMHANSEMVISRARSSNATTPRSNHASPSARSRSRRGPASLNMRKTRAQREAAALAHEKLEYLAYYDGLPGWRSEACSSSAWRSTSAAPSPAAQGRPDALDLERFKNINDSWDATAATCC